MKNSFLFSLVALLALLPMGLRAQMVEPVKWSFSINMTGDRQGEVVMKVTIDDGWHMYSMDVDPNVGPSPLSITFEKLQGVKLVGDPTPSKAAHEEYDDIFEAKLRWWTESVTIRQKFEATEPDFAIDGVVKYSACNDQNCIPPTSEIFELTGKAKIAATAAAKPDVTKEIAPVGEKVDVAPEPSSLLEAENASSEPTIAEEMATPTDSVAPSPMAPAEPATPKEAPSTVLGIFSVVLAAGLIWLTIWLFNSTVGKAWVVNSIGFLSLIVAIFFLGLADQAFAWRALDREAFLSLWIVTLGLWGLYLLGKFNLGKREIEGNGKISVLRYFIALVAFAFMVYLVPGLWGAPLDFIHDLLPPITTQDFILGGF
ncbi:MAG: protein-disulfide reductase DsbD N-terminal domain-containing protein [Bacteroidales bacterium]|nr:protein-disulfide reductase DsbD N-terminal domain-containing protein [Bacteroidales bacterium]